MLLSVYDDEQYLFQALRAGAAGYLLKRVSGEELVRSLEQVQRGRDRRGRDDGGARRRRRRPGWTAGSSGRARSSGLSQRESEVLGLIVAGLSNRAIAARLFIGDETVKSHARAIYRKLGVSDRTAAVAAALREGVFR